MKILSVGVSERTLRLFSSSVTVERADSLEYAEEIFSLLETHEYDALLVDLDNSQLGPSFVVSLRKLGVIIPILGIGGVEDMSWHEHRAKFLESGGDDLVQQPGNPREIVASFNACLRRIANHLVDKTSDVVVFEGGATKVTIEIDAKSSRVKADGYPIDLTRSEFLLFSTLVRRRDRVVTKEALLLAMYFERDEPEQKSLDVFVCKIRNKFDVVYPGLGGVIETVWGSGYRYTPETAQLNSAQRLKLTQ